MVVVTTMFTAPAACAGAVQLSEVALLKVTPVAGVPPNVTVAPDWKFVPVNVTDVPPVMGPMLGATLVMVGVGRMYVKPFASGADAPPAVVVTTTFAAPPLAFAG